MSAHPSGEELLALALGELDAGSAARVSLHAAACPRCAGELAWARLERACFSARTPPATDALWAGIAPRLASPAPARHRRPHWAARGIFGASAAASLAAVLVLGVVAERTPAREVAPAPDPRALAALDRADRDVRTAAAALEAELAGARQTLPPEEAARWNRSLESVRAQLGAAQPVASADVEGRMRLLDGYTGYVRSLQQIVRASREIEP